MSERKKAKKTVRKVAESGCGIGPGETIRVGLLTSGGDCQALNATLRGIAKTLYNLYEKAEIIGFLDGYRG